MEDEKYKLPARHNTVSETQRWIVNDIRPQIARMSEWLVNTNQTNSSIMKNKEIFIPEIEVDTLVYVNDGNEWIIRYFAHFGSRGEVYCFRHQKKSNETTLKDSYVDWSLANPLEEK